MLVHFALLVLSATPATTENLDQLEQRIEVETGSKPVAIDRRLKLSSCPRPPHLSHETSSSLLVQCEEVGWRLRVLLRNTSPLVGKHTLATPAVRKGETVVLEVAGLGFAIRREAIVLEDALAGASVRIRLQNGGPTMVATATSRSKVTLTP